MNEVCGIGAILDLHGDRVPYLLPALEGMNELLRRIVARTARVFGRTSADVGFAHRRLDDHRPRAPGTSR